MIIRKKDVSATPAVAVEDSTIIASTIGLPEVEQKPMTKDDYWRNKELRDVTKDIRISRQGIIQAAGLMAAQLTTKPEMVVTLMHEFADHMLKYVNADGAQKGV